MYSQYAEDDWILANLDLPNQGIFVDVGAGDGVIYSNTLAFERRGWTGLCIEPDPRNLDLLSRNRGCALEHCAIGSSDKSFYLAPDPNFSGFNIVREHRCPVQIHRLQAILAKHSIRWIDLLSIDVEGSELEVWDTLSMRPRIIIMEYLTKDLPSKLDDVCEVLRDDGYAIKLITETNVIGFYQL